MGGDLKEASECLPTRMGIGRGEGNCGTVTVGVESIGDTAKTEFVVIRPHYERLS